MKTKNLLLISGGIDSLVLAHELAKSGESFRMIHFDFEKDNRKKELSCAKQTASRLNVSLDIVKMGSVLELLLGQLPYEDLILDEYDSPGMQDESGDRKSQPSGFPILLAIATHYAQVAQMEKLYIGVEGDQASKRPGLDTFYSKWSDMLQYFDAAAREIEIVAPYLKLSKGEVVKRGVEAGAPLHLSWSCFNTERHHCGKCAGCEARIKAFRYSGLTDPSPYGEEIVSKNSDLLSFDRYAMKDCIGRLYQLD